MKPLVTSATLKTVLAEGLRFEKERDFDSLTAILSQFWQDFSQEPDTRGLSQPLKAEFLRLCGNFLTWYGRAKAFPEYQEYAKNLLTKADNLYKLLGDKNGRGKTACHLALSYCYDGRADTAYIFTTEAEKLFSKDSDNPIYLQLKINQMVSLSFDGKFEKCVKIIDEIGDRIEKSNHEYLPILFFNQCGYVFSHSGEYSLAVQMYRKAVEVCTKVEDVRSLSQASNNLANALRKDGYPKLAVEPICRALALALKLGDVGFFSIFEDTKANILLALGDRDFALKTINQTIVRLTKKGDVRTLCEAFWTKVEILLSTGNLDDADNAMLIYTQLGELARLELSEDIAKNYAEKLREKLSAQKKTAKKQILLSIITPFYPENERLENLPTGDFKLFFVPAKFAKAIGKNKDIIACTTERKENPLIIFYEESEEYFLGNVECETFYGDEFYSLKTPDGDEITFSSDSGSIEGHVTAIAEFNEDELIFERL